MAAASMSPEPATPKKEKKHKRDKSSKSEKKRAREEDAVADSEPKHKKSKSIVDDDIVANPEAKREKKKKRDKRVKHDTEDEEENVADVDERSSAKKKKKHRKETNGDTPVAENADGNVSEHDNGEKKKKKKKHKKHAEATDEVVEAVRERSTKKSTNLSQDDDAMDIDELAKSSTSNIYQPPDIPPDPHFPFFKQTVSLYEALYPNGWAQPVTNCEYQYLQHLQNKYVPSLRGVLMSYENVSLGPEPGREGAATNDETLTTVSSFNEYAVGFGWITADVDLFVPSRGAWMEGSVNLQTEGHIGVVCFGKFNASIEARRLPPSWKWVSNEAPEAAGFEETASVITADDHGVVRQVHSTGFWVDVNGDKIKGKIRFRIRNFDAGTSGESTYLSLEGTMLDKDSEKKLVKEEARMAQLRRQKKGGQRAERRRAPDFSMTRFTAEDGEHAAEEAQNGEAAVEASEPPTSGQLTYL